MGTLYLCDQTPPTYNIATSLLKAEFRIGGDESKVVAASLIPETAVLSIRKLRRETRYPATHITLQQIHDATGRLQRIAIKSQTMMVTGAACRRMQVEISPNTICLITEDGSSRVIDTKVEFDVIVSENANEAPLPDSEDVLKVSEEVLSGFKRRKKVPRGSGSGLSADKVITGERRVMSKTVKNMTVTNVRAELQTTRNDFFTLHSPCNPIPYCIVSPTLQKHGYTRGEFVHRYAVGQHQGRHDRVAES